MYHICIIIYDVRIVFLRSHYSVGDSRIFYHANAMLLESLLSHEIYVLNADRSLVCVKNP